MVDDIEDLYSNICPQLGPLSLFTVHTMNHHNEAVMDLTDII